MNAPSILTTAQRSVLTTLAKNADLATQFVLSGGTALAAFHLQHRTSDDLDFFSVEPVDALRMRRFVDDMRTSLGASDVESSRLYDRHIFLLHLPADEILKLEFTQYPYSALEPPLLRDGVHVESLRDIAADKLAALLDRTEPKDYYDLFFLLRGGHSSLRTIRADTEKKFSLHIDPVQLGAALHRSQRLAILPHLLKKTMPDEIRQFFSSLERSLKNDVF